MKNFLLTGMLLFFTLFTASAQFVKAELEVSGLTCSMCSLSTQKALKTLDFIGEIKPDLNKNVFYIQFKPGKVVNLDAMKAKVVAAGFTVSRLTAIFNFSQLPVKDKSVFQYEGNSYQFIGAPEITLEGSTRFTVMDKDFLPGKAFKKFNAGSTSFTLQPVIMPSGTGRVFHISLS